MFEFDECTQGSLQEGSVVHFESVALVLVACPLIAPHVVACPCPVS